MFRTSPQDSDPFGRYITSMIWVLMLETGGGRADFEEISSVDWGGCSAQISNHARLMGNTGK